MTTQLTANNNNNLISTELFTSTDNNFLITTNSDTQILALDGNDTIIVGPKIGVVSNFTIQAGQGDDSIQLNPAAGLNNSEIYSGQGDDTVRIKSQISKTFIQDLFGNNLMEIGASISDSTIQNGEGADLIRQTIGTEILRGTIQGGKGNDTLNLFTVIDSYVYLGQGNDIITIGVVDGTTIQSLTGNNTLTQTGLSSNSLFEFGSGNDTLTIGNLSVAGNAGNEIAVRAGAGNDSVTLNGNISLSLVNLGDGNDTVAFDGSLNQSRVQSLTGNNRFVFSDFSRANTTNTTVTGGIGADTIAMSGLVENFFGSNIITGIETLGSTGASTTIGANVQAAGIQTVLIEGVGADTISVVGAFTGNLAGNAAANTFSFTNTALLTGIGSIAGGTGTDNITLLTPAQVVTDAAFLDVSSVENLVLANGSNTVTFGINAAAAGLATVNLSIGGLNVVTASGVTSIVGSAGDDSITANAALTFVNFTGAGIDVLTFNQAGVNATVNVGATATNTITLVGAAGTSNVLSIGATTAAGNANIIGGAANDSITGGAGNDIINAGDGSNTVTAGAGNDSITTGAGNDTIIAGTGNDTINAGAGNNSIFDAGSGADVITHSSAASTVAITVSGTGVVTLTATAAGATATGIAGIDMDVAADFSSAAVILIGNTGDDTLSGGTGDDLLEGGAGDDLLVGGGGDDVLDGGIGADLIFSNSGFDLIVQATGDSVAATAVTGITASGGGDGTPGWFSNGTTFIYGNGVDVITAQAPSAAVGNVRTAASSIVFEDQFNLANTVIDEFWVGGGGANINFFNQLLPGQLIEAGDAPYGRFYANGNTQNSTQGFYIAGAWDNGNDTFISNTSGSDALVFTVTTEQFNLGFATAAQVTNFFQTNTSAFILAAAVVG